MKIQTNELSNYQNNIVIFMAFTDFLSKIKNKKESIRDKFPLNKLFIQNEINPVQSKHY